MMTRGMKTVDCRTLVGDLAPPSGEGCGNEAKAAGLIWRGGSLI
jgi:hypothetical protein